MLKIFDFIVSFCVLMTITLLGSSTPDALGGTVSLIILLPILYYFSYVLKIAPLEITLLSIVLLSIVGINYLSYHDLSATYAVAFPYCVLIVFILFCIYFALVKPSIYSHEDDQDNNLAILKQNYKFVVLKYIIFAFAYVLNICIAFISFEGRFSANNSIIKMIPISFICIPVSLVAMKFELKKIEVNQLHPILKEVKNKVPESLNSKKYFFVIMSVLFFLGSTIELLIRNGWILWVGTFVTINILISLMWNNYKCWGTPAPKDLLIKIDDVKPLNTPQALIKTGVINVIGMMLVGFGLLVLLYFINGL